MDVQRKAEAVNIKRWKDIIYSALEVDVQVIRKILSRFDCFLTSIQDLAASDREEVSRLLDVFLLARTFCLPY